MAKPIRVVITEDSMDEKSWKHALQCAVQIARKMKPVGTDMVLLTNTKAQIRNTALVQHLSPNTAKALDDGRRARIVDDIMLRHMTQLTFRHGAPRAIVIAFFADDKLMEFVDGLSDLGGIVAVPWLENSVDLWRDRWNPIVPGQAAPPPEAELIDDPVIVGALGSLAVICNLSYDLLQTRDKAVVDDTLRILRAKGHALDAGKIKSWAIRNGWKPKAADELAKLATRVAGLKQKPRISAIAGSEERYARWIA